MPKFNYKALDINGNVINGIVDAPSQELASTALIDKSFKIIDLEESKGLVNFNFKALSIFNGISKKDLVIFSRQLAVMISATVPIIQALRGITKQTTNQALSRNVEQIADDVDGGMKLSDAMSKHAIFDNFFVSMIAAGESSGRLDEVLNYLADEVEKSYDLSAKIKGAMIYPIFIISGLLLVGIAAMIFIIPNLTEMLQASGAVLPLPTRVLIFISDSLRKYYILIILFVAVFVFGLIYSIKKTELGNKIFNIIKIKFPVFGKLFKNIYLVRFSSTLSSLISAGVPLTEALRITGNVVGNYNYKKVINEAVKKVEDGYSIAYVFSESNLFPPMLSQMLKVGEKTGRLNIVLDKLSGFYAREVSNMVGNLTALIEPLIMVIIGLGVGGMVAAIIMPMYNMANTF
ncbi:MAG: type II secretion system F family protein [Patescibacteria group bacterium]|nr:type II secretion system F family protein [Patescibacteria group bacterium]MDD4304215.1 type II secretion system F family protein [Patescibacteria group bacterium]MDD4695248.1 type II secretion system F family protein [Patescibacteria group bacterium]